MTRDADDGARARVPKKPRVTPVSLQARTLDRLFQDPSKPVQVPEAHMERSVRAPREIMKNVSGSTAGASSGDFHVYKQMREREFDRIQIMEENAERQADYVAQQQKYAQADERKTCKNRARREKKKLAAQRGKLAQKQEHGEDRNVPDQ
ncbi:hypothetical protein MVES_002414 [Malassezia vespertilionis]|uniref:PRKR-interacting protein 1 n=1 Tax=Malassezia vespertilionis TaxID=2020962 RepID=A0A2N1JAA1_9BASI|nr:hypothetical protein MVES_002414 [Malassezia vespertilionis]